VLRATASLYASRRRTRALTSTSSKLVQWTAVNLLLVMRSAMTLRRPVSGTISRAGRRPRRRRGPPPDGGQRPGGRRRRGRGGAAGGGALEVGQHVLARDAAATAGAAHLRGSMPCSRARRRTTGERKARGVGAGAGSRGQRGACRGRRARGRGTVGAAATGAAAATAAAPAPPPPSPGAAMVAISVPTGTVCPHRP